VLDYTIAYVLCTYNPLFLTDQFSLKKLPLQFSLSYKASLFVFQLNEQIVATAGALFRCDAVFKNYLEYLANASWRFENVSGIKCEHWGTLKLATALKVVCFPEEDDDFHEVNHTI